MLTGWPTLHADSAVTLNPQLLTSGKAHDIRIAVTTNTHVQQLYLSPGGPTVIHRWSLPHRGDGLVWIDDMIYIAAGDGGLIIIDSHNINSPIQAQLSLGTAVNQISISHHHAWLATQRGLYTVDIRDADAPRIRAFVTTIQAITVISSNDRYAALGQGREIQLYDSRRPGILQALSTLQVDHDIHAIAIDGQQLLIAAGDSGVLRYQITPSQQLQLTGHYRTTGPAIDIQVDNGIAVVATQDHGLTLLDISDEQAIHWLGSHQQAGRVQHLFVDRKSDQQQVMLLNEQQQLLLIDISNPRMPTMLSSYPLGDKGTALAFRNNTVMALVNQQLQQLDFSAIPPQLSNEGLDFGQGVNYGGGRRVFIRKNIAYVADWFSGIHLYDISTPQQPRLLSSFHTDGSAKGIVVRGDYAYVADDDHGLQVINIRNPRRPFKVAALLTSGLAYIPVLGTGANKNRLYLASHRGGFQIIDISNPKRPTLLGRYDTGGKTWAIRVRDNIAYIADDNYGLMMFDVSQPDNIQLIGQYSPGGEAEDIILHGDVAYVAFFDLGLYIIDIEDPGYPKKLGHIKTPGNARGLARHDNILYIADWLAGIQVINIADPRRPQLIGSYDTAGAAWGLALKDGFAFVTDWWGGFSVLNIQRPSTPTLAGRYHHRDRINAISTEDKVLYAASGRAGLQIYDINNPLNPTWMTGVDFKARAIHVVTTKQRAYVALANQQIAIIDTSDPFSAYTLRQIPSPYPIAHLQLHRQWLLVNHGDRGVTFFRIDGKHADKPRKTHHIKTGINSTTFLANQSLAIAQANGLIKIYSQADDKEPSHRFKHYATLLQGYKDYLISYSYQNGIQLLKNNGDIISHIDTQQTILDMRVQGDSLYLSNDQQQLTIIDLSNIQRLSIKSHYTLLGPVTRITPANGTIYLSGNTTITALRRLPDSPWHNEPGNNHLTINIQATMPTGSYNLHINSQRIDNIIRIKPPRLSTPTFSMDDLNTALEKMRRQPF